MLRTRPFGVTLLLWLVLSLSAWGAIRLLAALRWWEILYEFEARLSPLYLAITGAGWALIGGVLLWSIWSAKAMAYWAIPGAIGLWILEYWIERSLAPLSRANLEFSIVTSMLLLFVTAIITLNRSTQIYFMRSEAHEQPDKDSTPA
ncbi:MAG TPA: hypothetical protein VFL31_06165 [Nitrospiraceae bacterium]|nr:hypothetical protein [Nitrospiraceae bacterium]